MLVYTYYGKQSNRTLPAHTTYKHTTYKHTCFVLWFTVVHLPQLIIFYETQRMKIYIVVTRECVVLVISQFYLGQKKRTYNSACSEYY